MHTNLGFALVFGFVFCLVFGAEFEPKHCAIQLVRVAGVESHAVAILITLCRLIQLCD